MIAIRWKVVRELGLVRKHFKQKCFRTPNSLTTESDCDTSYCLIVLAVRPSTLALQCHYRCVYILTFNEALGHDRTPL